MEALQSISLPSTPFADKGVIDRKRNLSDIESEDDENVIESTTLRKQRLSPESAHIKKIKSVRSFSSQQLSSAISSPSKDGTSDYLDVDLDRLQRDLDEALEGLTKAMPYSKEGVPRNGYAFIRIRPQLLDLKKLFLRHSYRLTSSCQNHASVTLRTSSTVMEQAPAWKALLLYLSVASYIIHRIPEFDSPEHNVIKTELYGRISLFYGIALNSISTSDLVPRNASIFEEIRRLLVAHAALKNDVYGAILQSFDQRFILQQ